ncbi:OmpA family protein [Rubrivivax albus]|uniref:OmpA family protein n=1 Tax=Rubrivivax albus TaxID=2499835 RepID=A0A3S2X0D4_9BURK|nr:OmpA family protein [Rubrivivax albus]RVT50756.1 OmpA family protein [Rubrivivax albus]
MRTRPYLPHTAAATLPWLLWLASCSSPPPRPPQVDESLRRPANHADTLALHQCQAQLQSQRDETAEWRQTAERRGQQILALQQADLARQAAALAAEADRPQAAANTMHTLQFAYGSTQVSLTREQASALLPDARQAPLVVLRGRTDGTADTPGESRIARERAAAVRDLLVGAGVDPRRIRTTHQPSGDHTADNTTAGGRALNRRVEVEIYRAAPVSAQPTRQLAD